MNRFGDESRATICDSKTRFTRRQRMEFSRCEWVCRAELRKVERGMSKFGNDLAALGPREPVNITTSTPMCMLS